MKPPQEPPVEQDVDDDWQGTGDSVPESQSRSLWIDGRFYIDLGTGKLNMAIREGNIVLAAADPEQQAVLEDILRKIVEYNTR
jgi:hypothetical protein